MRGEEVRNIYQVVQRVTISISEFILRGVNEIWKSSRDGNVDIEVPYRRGKVD